MGPNCMNSCPLQQQEKIKGFTDTAILRLDEMLIHDVYDDSSICCIYSFVY
jgi:hypothetical protein